jgi:hypothetical protein
MIEKLIDAAEKKVNADIFDLFDHIIAVYKGYGPHYIVEQWAAKESADCVLKNSGRYLDAAYKEMKRFIQHN